MGGIVARDFLERQEGWRDTRLLITFGTPYRGSVNALNTLSRGSKKTLGPITLIDMTEMARSLTSIYQLLPIYPCYDGGSGELQRVGEVDGIPGVDAARAAAALAYHHAIRDLVAQHGDDADYRDNGYALHPIVGIDQPTLQSARLDGNTVRFSAAYPGEDLTGDGTVPAVSAVPIDRSDGEVGTYSSERHSSLQNAVPMLTQVRGLLTAARVDLERFQAPPPFSPRLSLDVDTVADAGAPLEMRARANFGDPELRLTIADADSGAPVDAVARRSGNEEGWTVWECPPLPEGLYRVTLWSEAGETVTEVIAAMGDA
jgi:hypothetical protein